MRPHFKSIRGCTRYCLARRNLATAPCQPPTPRLRFAPSPTGQLHLGGLRTALFNHLLARKWKGRWVLRVEDTDRERFVEGAVDRLREALDWAGLDYDEGIGRGGPHGPYIQSERLDLYHQHVRHLLSQGHAYECFCSPDDLHAIRTSLLKQGVRVSYDSRCRHLTDEDRVRRRQAGHKYVVRFKDPGGFPVMPTDLVFGVVTPHSDAGSEYFDDFVLLKPDGYPTYHLASVVDDHAMEITHVLRGEEWLPSLPKHVQLYRAFDWEPPAFAHLPLLVNEDGTKLSKRKGDVTVDHFREAGYEVEAMLNYLSLLGWDYYSALESLNTVSDLPTPSVGPGSEILPAHARKDTHSLYEVFTVPQLISAFDLTHITRRKAAVSQSKLDFLNKMTLRRKAGRMGRDSETAELGKERLGRSEESLGEARNELIEKLQGMLRDVRTLKDCALVEDRKYVESVLDAEVPRITLLSDIRKESIYFFIDPNYEGHESRTFLAELNDTHLYVRILQSAIAALNEREEGGAEFTEDLVWSVASQVSNLHGLRARSEVMKPMRHALTGRLVGPKVPVIMTVLGFDRSLARLQAGLEHVKGMESSRNETNAS